MARSLWKLFNYGIAIYAMIVALGGDKQSSVWLLLCVIYAKLQDIEDELQKSGQKFGG